MSRAYFLTGTDTEIGKTFVSCALLHRARQAGLKSVGLKPVAAGTDASGENEDVAQLYAASSIHLPRDTVNPYCFQAAIAPHIAAIEEGVDIEFSRITDTLAPALAQSDFVIVEGVGGFCVPLGVDRDSADLAVNLGLPIILVVGMRLGCINHALLTVEAIKARGLAIAGWIANRLTPDMNRFGENFKTLETRIAAPCLGALPHSATRNPADVAHHLVLPE